MTILLCCAVLVFPRSLRAGWTTWWFVTVIILIISGIFWSRKQIDEDTLINRDFNLQDTKADKVEGKPKVEDPDLIILEEPIIQEEPMVCELVQPTLSIESSLEEAFVTEAEFEAQVPLVEAGVSRLDKEIIERWDILTIDELIDKGFKEKHLENYRQAAVYFSRALTLEPMPDLAFYLIIDYYWLLNNLEERDYALTELQVHIQKYLPQFNSELRYRFDAWMHKEDLIKYFN